MAGRPTVSASSRWLEGIRKWYYSAAGFNKLGLMRDDTIYENDDVKEAIRRLPENLYNDSVYKRDPLLSPTPENAAIGLTLNASSDVGVTSQGISACF